MGEKNQKRARPSGRSTEKEVVHCPILQRGPEGQGGAKAPGYGQWRLWQRPRHTERVCGEGGYAQGSSRQIWLLFSVKLEIKSSEGRKGFPWQTLGRAGHSGMGTGEIEKLHPHPSTVFRLCIHFFQQRQRL